MRMGGQPDAVTIEGWRSLQLDIQVRFCFHLPPALVADPQTLPTARFNTQHPRRTRPHLTAPILTGQPIWPEQSKPASHGAHRGASTCARPPPETILVRRGHGWRSQDRQACPVFLGARNPTRYGFPLFSLPRAAVKG